MADIVDTLEEMFQTRTNNVVKGEEAVRIIRPALIEEL